jgi:magnesium-protoporphyrin IX monomethyl ester (oxidative) cyclase
MRAQPHLLRGANTLWIRFFLLAVYATMYVRDHTRPMLHERWAWTATEYDYKVFRITSEISKQVFPVSWTSTTRPSAPAWTACSASSAWTRAKARGGLIGKLQQAGLAVAGAATFARLYLLPVQAPRPAAQVRVAPAW